MEIPRLTPISQMTSISAASPKEAGFDSSKGPLLGHTYRLPCGTRWLLTKALTPLTYQKEEPPFEARQVFECECVFDPENKYGGIKTAIMKMKYQIKGSRQSILFSKHNLEKCRKALAEASSSDQRQRRLENLETAEQLCFDATHPVEIPHRFTMNEIIALRRLRRSECIYTPQFLGNGGFWLTSDIDELAMEGGYMIGILMTKVPGRRVSYDWFFYGTSVEERDEIREAFKTALMEVWKRGIYPQDCALRNIIWDEEQRKCYILDFEDWIAVDRSDVEALWDLRPRWGLWFLSEDCGPSWFEGKRPYMVTGEDGLQI